MDIDDVRVALNPVPPWLRWLLLTISARSAEHTRLRFRFKELFEDSAAGSAGPVPSDPVWQYQSLGTTMILAGPDHMYVFETRRDATVSWAPDLLAALFEQDTNEPVPENRWFPGSAVLGCALRAIVECGFGSAGPAMPLPGGGSMPVRITFSEQCADILHWFAHASEAEKSAVVDEWQSAPEPDDAWHEWLLQIAANPETGALEEVSKFLAPDSLRELAVAALRGPLSPAAANALSLAAECGDILDEEEVRQLVRQIEGTLDPTLLAAAIQIASVAACAPSLRDEALDRLVAVGLQTPVGDPDDPHPVASIWGRPPACLANAAYALLLHDPARALPVIRRFMRNYGLATETTAMLLAIDVAWALREIEIAATECGEPAYEWVLIEYLRHNNHDFARRRLAERLPGAENAIFDAELLEHLTRKAHQFALWCDDVRDGALAGVKVPAEA